MSEVRLVVREAGRDWSGTIHGSDADRAIAALSADPVTLEELEIATERFHKAIPGRRFYSSLRPRLCDEPYDAGLVVIDLIARMVVIDSTYSSHGPKGDIAYHDGECLTDIVLSYHLADDWRFETDRNEWRHRAESRRRELAKQPIRDVRAVLCGKPFAEFIAREMFAAFGKRDEIAATVRAQWIEDSRQRLARNSDIPPEEVDPSLLTEEKIAPNTRPGQEEYASLFQETIRQVHANWLLTPREDLGGSAPREIMLERRNHLVMDLQDRCQQWSQLYECPRGIDESSHAFRHGGFGIHELVEYYELARELLWSCCKRLMQLLESLNAAQRPESLMVGDFLTSEVPRLEQVREKWLDTPDPEMHNRTPRSIIHRERRRLPEGMSGHEAIVDPDCPCCQMMADLPGPAFWHLDGCNMDDDFAFDIWNKTREEWEAEQREREEFNRKFDAEWAERKRLGVTDSSRLNEDGSPNVWAKSYFVSETADVPLGVRVFGLGCRLAELIVALRTGVDRTDTPPETQRYIDQLNRDFGNLREILQTSDSSLAEALFLPVVDRFTESLSQTAADRPDVASCCESLANELRSLLDPPAPEHNWESDDDLPF